MVLVIRVSMDLDAQNVSHLRLMTLNLLKRPNPFFCVPNAKEAGNKMPTIASVIHTNAKCATEQGWVNDERSL